MNCKRQIQLMGTSIDLNIYHANARELLNKAEGLLHDYNIRFSANDATSELMKVNQNAGIRPVQVHPDLFELIEIGKYHSLLPYGNFDMTIGPIVKLWKIGFKDAQLPDPETIKKTLPLVNAEKVILNRKDLTVFLEVEGMEIDLGALAKGYIADKIMTFLKENDVKSALINLGGNVLVLGDHPEREDGSWLIGLQNPLANRHQHLGLIPVKDQSVVTSGVYERYFVYEGKTYHHIFNKESGYPIDTQMASITVLAQNSLLCEIWTSQLFGLPLEEAMAILNALDDIEGIIVTVDNAVLLSDNLRSSFIKL